MDPRERSNSAQCRAQFRAYSPNEHPTAPFLRTSRGGFRLSYLGKLQLRSQYDLSAPTYILDYEYETFETLHSRAQRCSTSYLTRVKCSM